MKNASKNGKRALTTLSFLFGLLAFSFSAPPVPSVIDCDCSAPSVSKNGQTSTTVAFSWGTVQGATAYRVWYVRVEDNYTSPQTTTTGTSATFSNLPKGTYQFHFVTDCGVQSSDPIILDDLLMG